MIELDLFPTLVIIKKNFIDDNTRKQLKNLKPVMSKHAAILGEGVSSYHNTYDCLQNFEDLKIKIELELELMSDKLGITKQILNNTWVNKQKIGSSLNYHQHPSSKISGVIYIDVFNNSTCLKFLNPNPYISMQVNKNNTKYNNEYMDIQPENGSLILFPSWLSHGSDNNNTTREVLSFNSRDNG
jgi:uncharacterized protein (TIGR02466 family)